MKNNYIFFELIMFFCLPACIIANNVQISSVTLTNDSTITFNISWENSWRVSVAPNNHDAVWIFIKRKDCASGQWSHVELSSTSTDHTTAAPLEVYLDGKDAGSKTLGLFLRRSSDGTGNITNTAISIRMTSLPIGQYDFRVFGIEMVQVPEGSFQIGDGNVSTGSYKDGPTNNPFNVTSEGAISVGSVAGSLFASTSSFRPIALPAAFPKGFAEIYSMKHEISQGQYVDFVNILTSDQALNRQINGNTFRLNITGVWPVLVANTPHRPINFLGWADLLAYLDWAALRPMTELEFEKICRGPAAPVAAEFAWGSGIITDANTLSNDGSATEASTNAITAGGGIASFNNNLITGPIRCGFAAKAATSRFEAAAGYYGVMELSGNLWESTVSTLNSTGVSYTGKPGDGILSVSPSPGFANETNWPNQQASLTSSTSAAGKAQRGGSWNETSGFLRVSDRSLSHFNSGQRLNEYGGRGVR
jgi:formylglycine-generating enzyme required for sulfatase activity